MAEPEDVPDLVPMHAGRRQIGRDHVPVRGAVVVEAGLAPEDSHVQQRLRREVLRAERAAVIGLRDQGRIDDETLRLVERELDLEEQRLY